MLKKIGNMFICIGFVLVIRFVLELIGMDDWLNGWLCCLGFFMVDRRLENVG